MRNLILQAQNGDKEAFIQAINQCTLQLYKIGKTMLKDDNDIGDAIQDTILSAYEKLSTLKEASYFKTWLIRIFINKCNSLIKQKNKVIFIEDNPIVSSLAIAPSDNLDLNEAINTLNADYKMVISLYYIIGYSIKEICSILDEKEGTIKSRLFRAREKLRSHYDIEEGVQ